MKELKVFSKDLHLDVRHELTSLIQNFNLIKGGEGGRNTIKITSIKDYDVNIKAFKVPNIINQIVYNFFRKSKAQRSFEYANKLLEIKIGTPKPLAFFEYKTWLFFKKGFYVSEQLNFDLMYRDLTNNFEYPDFENILRAFTRFTYSMHEKGVLFLDHSPGNTLIKKKADGYEFYLVDLNRMKFESLDFESRIKNFSRLTIHKFMVEIMSDEYAKCSGRDYSAIFRLMWKETEDFQYRFHRKKRLKKKLLFK